MTEYDLELEAREEYEREWAKFRDSELQGLRAARLNPDRSADPAATGALFTRPVGTLPRRGPGADVLDGHRREIVEACNEQLDLEGWPDATRHLKLVVQHGCAIVEGMVGVLVCEPARRLHATLVGYLPTGKREKWRANAMHAWAEKGFGPPIMAVHSAVGLALQIGLARGNRDVDEFVRGTFPASYVGKVASGEFFADVDHVRAAFRNPSSHFWSTKRFTPIDYRYLSQLVWAVGTFSDWYYDHAQQAPGGDTPGILNHLAYSPAPPSPE
jgi:hypothetical protein